MRLLCRTSVSLVFLSGPLLAQVTYDRLLHSDKEPQNWLTYSGSYNSQRHSHPALITSSSCFVAWLGVCKLVDDETMDYERRKTASRQTV